MFQVRYDIGMEFSTWNEWIKNRIIGVYATKLLASDENRVAYIFLISGNVTTSQISTTDILFMLFYINIAFGNKMEGINQFC